MNKRLFAIIGVLLFITLPLIPSINAETSSREYNGTFQELFINLLLFRLDRGQFLLDFSIYSRPTYSVEYPLIWARGWYLVATATILLMVMGVPVI